MTYVEPTQQSWKDSVRAASAGSNVTLSGTQTLDGVALVAGDRFFAKDQTTGSQNGVYVVAAGAWAYDLDYAVNNLVRPGHTISVQQGTVNGGTQWVNTNTGTITLGTTALTYKRIDGAWDEWETLLDAASQLAASSAAGTYQFSVDGGSLTTSLALTGKQRVIPLDPANYAVTGKTAQLRIVGHVQTNSTAPGVNFTFGLYPISSIAALTATLGAVVSGSTIAINAPAANTQTAAYGPAFNMPAAGSYLLAVVTSAANSAFAHNVRAHLQLRMT